MQIHECLIQNKLCDEFGFFAVFIAKYAIIWTHGFYPKW